MNTLTYNIIHDEEQIRLFSRLFCSRTEGVGKDKDVCNDGDHCKLISLFTRSKYMSKEYLAEEPLKAPIKSSMKIQQSLFQCYRNEEYLVRHIRQLQVPFGAYTYRSKHSEMTTVPLDSMVIYVALHTKSTTCAGIEVLLSIQQQAFAALRPDTNIEPEKRLRQVNPSKVIPEITTSLHKANAARGTKKYLDIDVDTKDENKLADFIRETFPFIELSIICIIETYGGFHIILDAFKLGPARRKLNDYLERSEMIYEGISRVGKAVNQKWFSLNSSPQPPLPGCYQGGFPASFVTIAKFKQLLENEVGRIIDKNAELLP